MIRRGSLTAVAVFCLALGLRGQTAPLVQGKTPDPGKTPAQAGIPQQGKTSDAFRRGERIATAVGTVTSTAISPLLGVCVLGAVEYFRTPAEKRASLPGYARPWFWITVAVLLALILAKDSIGGLAPPFKKPLDALEVLLVNKAALVMIALPVVFHEAAKIFGMDSMADLFAAVFGALEPVAYAADSGAAGPVESGAKAALAVLTVAVGVGMSFVVWMVGHAFDVLVLLSPFPFLDLLLKAARSMVFAVLATATLANPQAALVLSLIVVAVCLLLTGWAARLLVYGLVMSWEILFALLLGERHRAGANGEVRCFTARRMNGIPKRSYGRLWREPDGRLAFRRRRWIVGPSRKVVLDASGGYELGRGLLQDFILESRGEASRYRLLFAILPSYRGDEKDLLAKLSLKGARDLRWRGGLKAFWRWLVNDSGETDATTATAAA